LTIEDTNLAGYINLPGNTSTSESYRVALQFAKASMGDKNTTEEHHSTLFAICLHNYHSFNGFRMNSALFSAHPDEKEILLVEGVKVAVLGVEDIYIDNSWSDDEFWLDFNKKTITVIYLFHALDFNPPEEKKKD